MASKPNFKVISSAIGPGFSMFRAGDIVAPDALQHGGGAHTVKWDTDRLLRIGAIERTDEEPTVTAGYEYSPLPDAMMNLRAEGEPDNAAQPTDAERKQMADVNEKRLDGASQRASAEGSAPEGKTAKQAADENRATGVDKGR